MHPGPIWTGVLPLLFKICRSAISGATAAVVVAVVDACPCFGRMAVAVAPGGQGQPVGDDIDGGGALRADGLHSALQNQADRQRHGAGDKGGDNELAQRHAAQGLPARGELQQRMRNPEITYVAGGHLSTVLKADDYACVIRAFLMEYMPRHAVSDRNS